MRRLAFALLCCTIASGVFPPTSHAQTGCTTKTQAQNLAALADGQAAGSITPQVLRNLACSTGNAQITPTGGSVTQTISDALGSVAVTASGTNQATAAALSAGVNVVTSVAPNTGVVLPSGGVTTVMDKGANTLNVYPASGAAIDSNATNSPVLIGVGGSATFRCTSSTQCYR